MTAWRISRSCKKLGTLYAFGTELTDAHWFI